MREYKESKLANMALGAALLSLAMASSSAFIKSKEYRLYTQLTALATSIVSAGMCCGIEYKSSKEYKRRMLK